MSLNIQGLQTAAQAQGNQGTQNAGKTEEESNIFNFNNEENKDFDWDLDDGKILFKDASSSFLEGMGDRAKEQFDALIKSAKENPGMTAICVIGGVAVGVLATVSAPVAIGVGLVGAGMGIKQTYEAGKNIYEASQDLKESTSDEETKEILKNMGSNTTDAIEGTITTIASVATTVSAAKGLQHGIKAEIIKDKAWNMIETENVGFENMPAEIASKWDNFVLDQKVEFLKKAMCEDVLEKAVITEGISFVPTLGENIQNIFE